MQVIQLGESYNRMHNTTHIHYIIVGQYNTMVYSGQSFTTIAKISAVYLPDGEVTLCMCVCREGEGVGSMVIECMSK